MHNSCLLNDTRKETKETVLISIYPACLPCTNCRTYHVRMTQKYNFVHEVLNLPAAAGPHVSQEDEGVVENLQMHEHPDR